MENITKFEGDLNRLKQNASWRYFELCLTFIIGYAATSLVPFFSGRRSNHRLLNYFVEHTAEWALWGLAIGLFATIVIYLKRKDDVVILSISFNEIERRIDFETKTYYAFKNVHSHVLFSDFIYTVNSYSTEFEYHLKIDFYQELNGKRSFIGTLSNQDFLWERKGQIIKQLRKKLESIKK